MEEGLLFLFEDTGLKGLACEAEKPIKWEDEKENCIDKETGHGEKAEKHSYS